MIIETVAFEAKDGRMFRARGFVTLRILYTIILIFNKTACACTLIILTVSISYIASSRVGTFNTRHEFGVSCSNKNCMDWKLSSVALSSFRRTRSFLKKNE